ncbi:MAG: N-acetyltransferase [Dehalococcoidia bacterium]|nr:MAG: N-acetyltransferase [Dehalococcoidia bacterium]
METPSPCGFDAPLGTKTRLRAKTLADAGRDYRWQCDPETACLDATEPLRMPFVQYLAEYRKMLSLASPERRFFAIETLSGQHIGNCSYYGIDRQKGDAELGIMIGERQYRGKGYGSDAATTLLDYIFRQTDLKKIRLKTLWDNLRAQRCFAKCGFIASGEKMIEGHHFLLMETDRERWRKATINSAAEPADRTTRA